MAYTTTSDSIIIRATLTEKGKKLLSRGKFKVAKFTLGDDEVDYRLYNADEASSDSSYKPAIKNAKLIEALKDTNKNIEFGLDSYDSGILYLTDSELATLEDREPHAFVEYLPMLIKNTKTTYAPTVRQDRYYVSVNDETTKLINDNFASFKFLETNDQEKVKIIIESGIHLPPESPSSFSDDSEEYTGSIYEREEKIVKKFLLDEDMMIYADNRLISTIVGIQQSSQFENFASGHRITNFNTANMDCSAISLESGFDYFATYLLKTIPNNVIDVELTYESLYSATGDESVLVGVDSGAVTIDKGQSNLNGPRGTVTAFNIKVDNELKVNSTGERDSRFTQFGTIDNILFSEEMPTRKFDYIDTTIYIVGATTNSRLQVPIRIIRYAGT